MSKTNFKNNNLCLRRIITTIKVNLRVFSPFNSQRDVVNCDPISTFIWNYKTLLFHAQTRRTNI